MTSSRLFAIALASLVTLLDLASASALPRFAVREGVTCKACHVNPSGGGMRNRYGRYVYAPIKLPQRYVGKPGSRLPLDVELGESLSLGGDARMAALRLSANDPAIPTTSTFFLMQADLYVTAKPFDKVTLYTDLSVYDSFEAFALYDYGSTTGGFSGYLKAGRFTPSYGLRLANHSTFTREEIGFGPRDKDVGLEAGWYVGPAHVQVAVVNGAGAERTLDDNSKKAWLARIELMKRVGPMSLVVGGSGYFNVSGVSTNANGMVFDSRVKSWRTGVHWGASLGRIAYLGEANIVGIKPALANTSVAKSTSFRSYQELAALVTKGVDLIFGYEFREPDLDLASGKAHRISVGFEYHPIPSVEIKVLVRRSIGRGPAEQSIDGFDEQIVMIHTYF